MSLALVQAVAAAALAQAPAAADAPAVHFEVRRSGATVWQGVIAVGQTLRIDAREARRRGETPSAGDDATETLYLRLERPVYPRLSGGRHEYAYTFSWRRTIQLAGQRPAPWHQIPTAWTLSTQGYVELDRRRPVTVSLPDEITVLFRR